MTFARSDAVLFNREDLSVMLRGLEREMKTAIDRCDRSTLLASAPEELVQQFVANFELEPVELLHDSITQEQTETTVDVRTLQNRHDYFVSGRGNSMIPATATSFYVAFSGNPDLFELRPNTFTSNPPQGAIGANELICTYVSPKPDHEKLQAAFEDTLQRIQSYLDVQRRDLESFGERQVETARAHIAARRERLLQAQTAAAGLRYPLRQRADAPMTYASPKVRRKIAPRSGVSAVPPSRPEPVMAMADYEHILHVMQNMGLVLERSPSAFSTMGEENLRQHFLVQLNGQYDGQATGETFNVSGRTDILLRDKGRNIFIAECKFWKGPAVFSATIDQLLSYTSWRDTKTAIVVFNRDTKLSTVLTKIPECLREHPRYKRSEPIGEGSSFRATFGHADDPMRELIITVLVFDVPAT